MFLGKNESARGICHCWAQGKRGLHLADAREGFLRSGVQIRGAAQGIKKLSNETIESDETPDAQRSGRDAKSAVADHGAHGQNNRQRTGYRESSRGLVQLLF